jgi:hypothetical protein
VFRFDQTDAKYSEVGPTNVKYETISRDQDIIVLFYLCFVKLLLLSLNNVNPFIPTTFFVFIMSKTTVGFGRSAVES